VEDRDNSAQVREKLAGTMRRLALATETVGPAILALLGVESHDSEWAALDPGQRRQRIEEALAILLSTESRERLVVLVLEDLHWSDHETLNLLNRLTGRLVNARCLIVVTCRPGVHVEMAGTIVQQVRADALSQQNASDLLDALLGTDASLGPLKSLLAERAGGKSLYLGGAGR